MAVETAHIGSNNVGVDVINGKMSVTDTSKPAATNADPIYTRPVKGTPTEPASITTGADAQVLAASTRISATFQNVGNVDIWLTTTGTASASVGLKLEPGKSLVDVGTNSAWRAFSATASTLRILVIA